MIIRKDKKATRHYLIFFIGIGLLLIAAPFYYRGITPGLIDAALYYMLPVALVLFFLAYKVWVASKNKITLTRSSLRIDAYQKSEIDWLEIKDFRITYVETPKNGYIPWLLIDYHDNLMYGTERSREHNRKHYDGATLACCLSDYEKSPVAIENLLYSYLVRQ